MVPGEVAPIDAAARAHRVGPRLLWRLSNVPRPPQIEMLRLALGMLTGAYILVLAFRIHRSDPATLLLVRAALTTYAGLGFLLVHRFSWRVHRLYSVVLSLGFGLGAAYCHGMLGNTLAQVPITALAIAMPMLLLHTGVDFALVFLLQLAGQGALLAVLPPPQVPLGTVAAILGVSVVVGGVAGMTLLAYRITLHESLRSLERALRAKSAFLNTMSHELRSPLHVVVGYAEMLRDYAPCDEALQLTNRIRGSALELLHLVENTMEVARLGEGTLRLYVQEFAPAEVIEELAQNLGALPEAQGGVPVYWEVAPDLPRTRLDRLKLKEIVQNLVSNALKFTRDGCIRVRLSADEHQLRIAVQDTGPGIPAASQDRIFEMFERVEEPGGPMTPGAGLGLYIVKSLVQLMSGQIEVQSAPGAGTCFTVRLPLALSVAA